MTAAELKLTLESPMVALRLILPLMTLPNCLPVPAFFVTVLADQPLHDSFAQPVSSNVHSLCLASVERSQKKIIQSKKKTCINQRKKPT